MRKRTSQTEPGGPAARQRGLSILLAFSSIFAFANRPACAAGAPDDIAAEASRVRVIFDTDIGSDCDDAGALALLHALADLGEVDILGVVYSSGRNEFGVGVCDAINTWYGRGDLPLGKYAGNDVGDTRDDYNRRIATDTRLYGHDVVSQSPELVATYKSLLRSQPDGSVTIVTVGHPHGLVHLMRDRDGARLIRAKVVRWIAQGGAGLQPQADWNFHRCGMDLYLAELLAKWPKDAYFVTAGADILTGHRQLPSTPEANPVREAYRLWNEKDCLEKGRSSWDQVTTLFAVRPQHFEVEHRGRVERTADGKSFWNARTDNARHHRVSLKVSTREMAEIVESLMARPPASRAMNRKESPKPAVLDPGSFGHYIDTFNKNDEELYVQHVPNAKAREFLRANIPLLECPDKDIERTYYFRWWTYRKHIKETPDGFVITEFLPQVGWSGKHNTISCPAAHHFYEGHECQWNGPSWPYSTSVTLTAPANLLNRCDQDYISKADHFDLLRNYARSHTSCDTVRTAQPCCARPQPKSCSRRHLA